MGTVYADIKLVNCYEKEMARRHIIGEEEVRELTVNMLVDSGAFMMAINENVRKALDLPLIEKRWACLENEEWHEFEVVGPIIVKFENRTACCNALVLEGNSRSMLGAIPMGEMDVLIHPKRQELIVNPAHPDGAVLRL